MVSEQLELGIAGSRTSTKFRRRCGRTQRAAWWFAHMRRVVNDAVDWPDAPRSQEATVTLDVTAQKRYA